jgi:hypothetical protein
MLFSLSQRRVAVHRTLIANYEISFEISQVHRHPPAHQIRRTRYEETIRDLLARPGGLGPR